MSRRRIRFVKYETSYVKVKNFPPLQLQWINIKCLIAKGRYEKSTQSHIEVNMKPEGGMGQHCECNSLPAAFFSFLFL